jgi:2'-5' RNA ligase
MQQLSLFEQSKISSQFAEYFFVLSPPPEVSEKIIEFKNNLNQKIEIGDSNLFSKPHITLLLIPVRDLSGDTVQSYAEKGFQDFKKINISIEKATYFEHNFTKDIVYKFDEPNRISRLVKKLHENLGLKFDGKKFTPHLTIARGIERNKLSNFNSMHEFNFKSSFTCDRITILKRDLEVYNARVVKRSAYSVFGEIGLDKFK